jgi:hypothetical protein
MREQRGQDAKAAVDVEGPSGIERVSIGVRTGREILVLYRT